MIKTKYKVQVPINYITELETVLMSSCNLQALVKRKCKPLLVNLHQLALSCIKTHCQTKSKRDEIKRKIRLFYSSHMLLHLGTCNIQSQCDPS